VAATFLERLARSPQIGTFVKLGRSEVVDVLALAGFDFLVLDLEHGQSSFAEARETLLAARANGIDMLVRLGAPDHALANRLVEAGAAGIQLSSVTSRAAALAHRASLHYQPDGDRSISLAQPAARYGATPLRSYLDGAGARMLVVGQLETADYEDGFAEILDPLDVAFIGPTDLSVAAGTPGDIETGSAAEVVDAVEAAAAVTGTVLGTFAGTAAQAQIAVERGYRYVVVASDIAVLGRASHDLLAAVRPS